MIFQNKQTKTAGPRSCKTCSDLRFQMVGVAGFEPTASSSRTKRATKLRHTPKPLQSLVMTDCNQIILTEERRESETGTPGNCVSHTTLRLRFGAPPGLPLKLPPSRNQMTTKSTSTASGLQATRTGVKGEVPNPVVTLTQEVGWCSSPVGTVPSPCMMPLPVGGHWNSPEA